MRDLPTGAVTFLFADVERSTELALRLGDRCYAEVLAEYQQLIRGLLCARGGREISAEGDSIAMVFGDAREAVLAAVDAQRAISDHRWPAEAQVRARMGLHTGHPIVLAGGYFGLDMHRAARICSAGHGGQILLSAATYHLVERAVQTLRVQDLGAHSLKDLDQPEKIFQIVAPDGLDEFPPLRSLSIRPNNLPLELTSFIGRERETAEIKRTLAKSRMVTLVGGGGSGKTRLALHVAAELVDAYPDGTWLVEFGSLGDASLVPHTVAVALRVREEPETPLTASITTALRRKSLLLVLDNCEHVITDVSALADLMLKTCAGLRILATSRQALAVPGETLWLVPSLSMPERQRAPVSAEQLVNFDAVRLFLERAASMQPGLAMTPASSAAIVEVCRHLDGIPLAIEFAAARTKVLSVEQIAARLDDRFRLLTGGARTAPPRHRTLQGAMDWSYDLLSVKEQLLLRRLSVFAGGWTLEAAEEVCAGETLQADAVLDMLTQLVDKSLVLVETRISDPRYRLLESVRQYAQGKLAGSGEAGEVRRRHAAWFMTLAEHAGPELSGANQAAWQERLEVDLDNFRAAMQWSLEDPETDAGVRIAGALHWFWYVRGYFSEGVKWLETALAATNRASEAARARALQAAGSLMLSMRRYDRAAAFAAESRAVFEKANDPRGVALACTLSGYVALDRGDYVAARLHLDEALGLAREQADMLSIKTALNHLGELERCRGDYGAARRFYEEGLAVARAQTETRGVAGLLANLGFVASHEGDYDRAAALFSEALQICRALRHRLIIVALFIGLARVAVALSEQERAARLLGAAEVVLGDLGTHLYRADRLEYEEVTATLRDRLAEADYATLTAEGRSMTLEQAIVYALREGE